MSPITRTLLPLLATAIVCSHYSEAAVNEEPSFQAPYDLEAIRMSDTSIVLRWDISNNALDHLQFFKIQYKLTRKDSPWKTENKEILPTTKAYQINNLRPGGYFFIVVAVYDNDDNVSSEQFKYRLRARSKMSAQDMPEQRAPTIHWSESASDYIRFKWKYPFKEKDMSYFGYLVYYRSGHHMSDFVIYNTLDENVEIVDLEPDTPYEAKVVAYNSNGVSDFSETITIKTKPKANSTISSTTPVLLSTTTTQTTTPTMTTETISTTRKPNLLPVTGLPYDQSTTIDGAITPDYNGSQSPVAHSPSKVLIHTTQKPILVGPTTTIVTAINSNSTSNFSQHSLSSLVDLILGGQSDTTLAIRYSFIVLLPILIIVFASICLISCHHRRKDSPPSSTHDSMQFDLEINGYFKNSFPGVEKEYSSTTNHNAHHGFVNNHPHINDFS